MGAAQGRDYNPGRTVWRQGHYPRDHHTSLLMMLAVVMVVVVAMIVVVVKIRVKLVVVKVAVLVQDRGVGPGRGGGGSSHCRRHILKNKKLHILVKFFRNTF